MSKTQKKLTKHRRNVKGKKQTLLYKHQSYLQKEEMRQNFLSSLRQTMLEDHNTKGAKTGGLLNKDANYYITPDGKLTEAFVHELDELKDEEIKFLEQTMKDARPVKADCFGIKRRFCAVCESDCKGYHSSSFMFASDKHVRGEFPTFCQDCGCPAHFHSVEQNQVKFPDDLSQLLTGNNITSDDLNFNCVLVVLLLENHNKSKIDNAMFLLKNEGMEVISLSHRHIEAEEAFLLRSKIVNLKESNVRAQTEQNFKKISQHNELKNAGSLDNSKMGGYSEHNPFVIEQETQVKEDYIQKQGFSILKAGTNAKYLASGISVPPTPSNENVNKLNQVKIAEKTVKFASTLASVKEEGEDDDLERDNGPLDMQFKSSMKAQPPQVNPIQKRIDEILQESQKRAKLLSITEAREQKLKLKSNIDKQTKKFRTGEKSTEQTQIEFLVKTLENNITMQMLLANEIAFVVLSSSSNQDLSGSVKKVFASYDEIQLLYYSQNRIQALSDCVNFTPNLFKLCKSIIISEPLREVTEQFKTRASQDSYLAKLSINEESLRSTLGKQRNDLNSLRLGQKGMQTHFKDRKAVTMQSKLGNINRSRRQQRQETHQPNQRQQDQDDSDSGISHASWVMKIKGKKEKPKKLQSKRNVLLFNYGVMRDYLNYSGMSVQLFLKCSDLSKPQNPGGIRGIKQSDDQGFNVKPQPCNIFAIAKVGLPNIIMPNSLDIKLTNFENYDTYTDLCDYFFPESSKTHYTVVVLRPCIVNNGLGDIMVQILRANECLIIKKKVRMLTKEEVTYLQHAENIPEANRELYTDLMLAGPCQILVISKIGAVTDVKTIIDGANPFGRRRLNQEDDTGQTQRQNVDSVNAMFEIAPFNSFNELIDLEGFMVRNSNLGKIQKQQESANKLQEFIINKKQVIRDELAVFQRYFNLVAYCSRDIDVVQKEIAIFSPQTAQIEDIILILNPIYNSIVEDAFEVLVRQNYTIIQHRYTYLTQEECFSIFNGQIDLESDEGKLLKDNILAEKVHIFHLSKMAAEREARVLYKQSDIQLQDLVVPTDYGTPLKPVYIPYVFFFVNQAGPFEECLKIVHNDVPFKYNGSDFLNKIPNQTMVQIMQIALLTTTGDSVKTLRVDAKTEKFSQVQIFSKDKFTPILVKQEGNPIRDGRLEPQIIPNVSSLNLYSQCFTAWVESNKFGPFEVRFQNIKPCQTERQLLQQFQSLGLYYNEVNKISNHVCPKFYRFKIGYDMSRAFEVEESMGGNFIEELAELHRDHLKLIEHSRAVQQPKSLPAFLFGQKLSEMCKKLILLKSKIKGAGEIIYDEQTQSMVGEQHPVTQSSYYNYDKQRFTEYLENLKKGWEFYLSVLEIDIIEMKLNIILNSFTFRYTRDPQWLRLYPERIDSKHLRISEKITFPIQQITGDVQSIQSNSSPPKVTDEFTSKKLEEVFSVQALVETITQKHTQTMLNDKLQKEGKSLHMLLQDPRPTDYTIKKEVSIAGFSDGIARRPIHQFMAQIMWIFDFEYRKINRKSECFLGNRNQRTAMEQSEKEYDEILDTVIEAATSDYMRGQDLALNSHTLKEGGFEGEFEKQVREKLSRDTEIQQRMKQRIEEEKRKLRSTMTLQELLKTEVHEAGEEARKKQHGELKSFLNNQGKNDPDGQEFQNLLEQGKTSFGPFAVKLASEFVNSQARRKQMESNPKIKDQEFISFLKMEYFLKGVSEANYVVKKLKFMEEQINELNENADKLQLDQINLQNQIRQLPLDPRFAEDRKVLQAKNTDMSAKIVSAKQTINDHRHQISIQESELLLIFKELIYCDIFVPDDYFDKLGMDLNSKLQNFQVPLSTYWREVKIGGEYIEKDLNHPRFKQIVGLSKQAPGEFISEHIRDAMTPARKQFLEIIKKGAPMSNLHKVEEKTYPKYLYLEKFESQTEKEERLAMEKEKALFLEQQKHTIKKIDFSK